MPTGSCGCGMEQATVLHTHVHMRPLHPGRAVCSESPESCLIALCLKQPQLARPASLTMISGSKSHTVAVKTNIPGSTPRLGQEASWKDRQPLRGSQGHCCAWPEGLPGHSCAWAWPGWKQRHQPWADPDGRPAGRCSLLIPGCLGAGAECIGSCPQPGPLSLAVVSPTCQFLLSGVSSPVSLCPHLAPQNQLGRQLHPLPSGTALGLAFGPPIPHC